MPYVQNVAGLTGVNYRAEPYLYREEAGCSLGRMFQPCEVESPQDPVTPIIEAHAGDQVRIHVFGASSEQNGMFTVEKHEWPIEPFLPGADMDQHRGIRRFGRLGRVPAVGRRKMVVGRGLCVEQRPATPIRNQVNGGTSGYSLPMTSGFCRSAEGRQALRQVEAYPPAGLKAAPASFK